MRKTIKAQTVIEVTDDILCNACGMSCRAGPDNYSFEGLIGVVVTGGFYSKALGDMNKYSFDVCEKCLVEWLDTFKIDPQVKDLQIVE